MNHPDQKMAETKLAYWLINDMLPYEITGNKCFIEFIRCFTKRFQIPSPKVIRTRIVPDLDKKVQWTVYRALSEHASDGGVFSVTTDLWTSPSKDSFMSFTIHFVNKDFKRKLVVLRCIRYNTSHSAEFLAGALKGNISSKMLM